jgi:hypothetical protein
LYGSGVTNPAINIQGNTTKLIVALPITVMSTMFIATSMDSIEIRDIPQAVRKADFHGICFDRIMLSSAIEVRIPFTIASAKIIVIDQAIPVS